MEFNEFFLTKNDQTFFENLSDKSKGRIITAIFAYLNNQTPNLNETENLIFKILQQKNEERAQILQNRKNSCSIAGKLGALKRWQKNENVDNNIIKEHEIELSTIKNTKQAELSTQNGNPIMKIAPPQNDSNNLRKFSKLINKNNIFYPNARAKARAPISPENMRNIFKKHLPCEVARYTPQINDLYNEVIDTIIEASEQATSEIGLKFRQRTYNIQNFTTLLLSITEEQMYSIIQSLYNGEAIKNRPFYILGAIINAGEKKCEQSEPKSAEEIHQFIHEQFEYIQNAQKEECNGG